MQWSSAANAGFTTASAKPWLAVNPNYTTINAAQEVADPDSVYSYIARLIALRAKTHGICLWRLQGPGPTAPTNFRLSAHAR